MPYKDDGPRPEAGGQTPDYSHSTPHDLYMRQLAARIAWLNKHTHWWLRELRKGRAA